jgi:hypothetical protein
MKKIALIAACLLSTQAFSMVTSSTQVDPTTHGTQNRYTDIYSGHNYTLVNDSGVTQTVSVCYTTIACPEYAAYTQRAYNCDQITLSAGQTKSDRHIQHMQAVFKFHGWCNINAITEIKGWQGHSSSAAGKLDITP